MNLENIKILEEQVLKKINHLNDERAALNALQRVDVNMLSPMKALEFITSLQEKLKGDKDEN